MLGPAPGTLGTRRMSDLIDLLSRLRGGTVLCTALYLSRSARLRHVRAYVDGVWTVQTRLRPSVNVQGGGCIPTGVWSQRHSDRVEAWCLGRSVTFAPKLVKAKLLRRLWFTSGHHGTESAEARGRLSRHGLSFRLVEFRRPVAHARDKSSAAIHPYYISLHSIMGIL